MTRAALVLEPISLTDVVEGGAVQLAVSRIGEVCRTRLQGFDAVVKILVRTNHGRDKDDPTFEELERDMDHELEAYAVLAHLQGSRVPRFLWTGPLLGGLCRALVTEYSGVGLDRLTQKLRWEQADSALEAVDAVHAEGVLQGDPVDRNLVVRDDGRVLVVDFSQARLRAASTSEDAPWESRAAEERAAFVEVLRVVTMEGWAPFSARDKVGAVSVDSAFDLSRASGSSGSAMEGVESR